MAKNVEHVSHVKSKLIVDGKPKLPQASSLVEGEIAINFAKGVETISTKNESGDVVTFSSDNYYTEQKLGSSFTGENSGKTVTEVITAHTASTSHMSTTEKTNLDSLSGNIATISGITSTKVSAWDGAATNSHTHSNKTALDSITGNVGTMAYQNTSSYLSATQVNTALSGKSNTGHTHVSSEVTGMSGYTKPSTTNAIATGDTLNGAIGKLEKGLDNATANIVDLSGQSETIAAAIVDLNTKLAEALENANTALANANTALEALSGHTIKVLTQAEYDALAVKDPDTVYMITN